MLNVIFVTNKLLIGMNLVPNLSPDNFLEVFNIFIQICMIHRINNTLLRHNIFIC